LNLCLDGSTGLEVLFRGITLSSESSPAAFFSSNGFSPRLASIVFQIFHTWEILFDVVSLERVLIADTVLTSALHQSGDSETTWLCMTEQPPDSDIIIESLELISTRLRDLRKVVYRRLYEKVPEAAELFSAYPKAQHKKMLDQVFSSALERADGDSWLQGHLADLAQKHVDWGVTVEMYPLFLESLLEALAETFGDAWESRFEAAWRQHFIWLTSTMTVGHTDA